MLKPVFADQAELEALRREVVELRRSNCELEQFAYVTSHELQEPLRMVSSYVELFEKKYKDQLDDKADKYIGHAAMGAKRMQLLIAGLLEYSRVGGGELPTQVVQLDCVLDQALAILAPSLQESSAHVTREPLPLVRGHAALLAQVFQNLVANAYKFRRPGTSPRMHVSASAGDGEWTVSVKDDGIGIAPEFFERIFHMFERLHTRDEYPGTGIGLSICKKVVERHGGRIWVESRLGHGATFFFTLPAIQSRR